MNAMKDLLEQVAAGTMSPDEATARLNEMRADEAHAAPGQAGQPPLEDLRQIVVRGGAVRLTIIGDPNVAEAVAEGAHRMERRGDALIINSNVSQGEYTTEAPRSGFMNFVSQVVDRVPAPLQPLTIRVNPSLYLRVLVMGGTLDLSNVRVGAAIGIEAGTATITQGYGPLVLDVASGSAKVDWIFNGESKIKVDMGSVKVKVSPQSDVRVTAEATLGQAIVTSGASTLKSTNSTATPPLVVGAGAGTLHVVSRMGSADVAL